jgi:hypothetical protein
VNLLPRNKYEWFWCALTLAGILVILGTLGFIGWLWLLSVGWMP